MLTVQVGIFALCGDRHLHEGTGSNLAPTQIRAERASDADSEAGLCESPHEFRSAGFGFDQFVQLFFGIAFEVHVFAGLL